MTSHVAGYQPSRGHYRAAGSKCSSNSERSLLHMQQQVLARHFRHMGLLFLCDMMSWPTSWKYDISWNTHLSVDVYLREGHPCQILSQSNFKWRSLMLFLWNDVIATILKVWRHIQNPTDEQSCQISSQSDLKQQNLQLFFKRLPPRTRSTTTTRTRGVVIWDQCLVRNGGQKMFYNHKPSPIHLAMNNNTPIQPSGTKKATDCKYISGTTWFTLWTVL